MVRYFTVASKWFKNCIIPVPVLVLGDYMLHLGIDVNQLNMEKLEIICLCLYTLRMPSAYGDVHLKNSCNKLVLISFVC
jgi:hypothetical protein